MGEVLSEQPVSCPYCGEALTILVDASAGDQAYVEDCQVCCRPMNVAFTVSDGELTSLRVTGDA